MAFLFLAPSLAGLFWQSGPLGPILWLGEVLCRLLIAFRYLFLAKLVSRLFLLFVIFYLTTPTLF